MIRSRRVWLAASLVLILLAVVALVANARETEEQSGSAVSVAFLGDSYTTGFGASKPERRWTSLVCDHLGWTQLNFGVGGTGYLNPLQPHVAYPYRVSEIAARHPDVVVVSGGYNDRGLAARAPQEELAAIRSTFAKLRKALPNATLYAVRPFAPAGPEAPVLGAIGSAVEQSVQEVGGTYLDIGDPLRYAPEDMYADGIHPNDPGYRALAEAFEHAYARAH